MIEATLIQPTLPLFPRFVLWSDVGSMQADDGKSTGSTELTSLS